MDWNMILFVSKWATIGVFYSVLLFLLFGVYREMSAGVRKEKTAQSTAIGRLRVLAASGDDPSFRVGSVLDLQAETSLGAERDNTIVLRDSYVSAHHARLRWDGVNWWIEDLNSTNGTLLNSQRCLPGSPQPFLHGSRLTIGDMQFELIEPDAE